MPSTGDTAAIRNRANLIGASSHNRRAGALSGYSRGVIIIDSMFDRQLKQAISGHMAQGNEHTARSTELMARSTELMARGNELMGGVRHEIELSRRDRADLAVFIREITTRIERHGEATVRAIDASTSTLEEMRKDIRANTEATLSVIDRLEPPPA